MQLTFHAISRSEQRLGLKPYSFQKLAIKADLFGFRAREFHGQFKKYLSFEEGKRGGEIRVFGDFIYVYRESCLITVFGVPGEFKSALRNFRKALDKKRKVAQN